MSAFTSHGCESSVYRGGPLALIPMSFRGASFSGTSQEPRELMIKRAMDVVLALIGLAIASIPMLLIAIAVRLTSRGPALFCQERIGLNGRRFIVLKFRTMHQVADDRGSLLQATRADPRVSRVGAVLRHTSLDELPQLLNVLAGSMSLVGPRPHAPGTCAAGRPFEAVAEHYAARHCFKPGMTGLAQIRGWRGETDTEEKLLRRIDSDLEYIATWSLRRDFLILWQTVVRVLHMPNAY